MISVTLASGGEALRPGSAGSVSEETMVGDQRINASVRLNTVLVVATFVIGLIVDRYSGFGGQLAVGAWCWVLMFRLIATSPSQWRVPLYCCLIWATAGEIFLSLVWGPVYLPPGEHSVLHSARPRIFVLARPCLRTARGAVFCRRRSGCRSGLWRIRPRCPNRHLQCSTDRHIPAVLAAAPR